MLPLKPAAAWHLRASIPVYSRPRRPLPLWAAHFLDPAQRLLPAEPRPRCWASVSRTHHTLWACLLRVCPLPSNPTAATFVRATVVSLRSSRAASSIPTAIHPTQQARWSLEQVHWICVGRLLCVLESGLQGLPCVTPTSLPSILQLRPLNKPALSCFKDLTPSGPPQRARLDPFLTWPVLPSL